MSQSILQDEKVCWITGTPYNLHKHHIFFGTSNRKLSEKYGCWVWLRADWHNMADYGVHFNKKMDNDLKRIAQKKAMEVYGWSIEEFIRIFGRSYL